MSRLSRQTVASRVVQVLKRKENTPCIIMRNKEVRCHLCKAKHDHFLIKNFDSQNKLFTIIHNDKTLHMKSFKQTSSEFQKFLVQCFQRRHVNIKDLLKKVDISEFERNLLILFRLHEDQDELLKSIAEKKQVSVSQYIRSKLLD